MKDKLTHGVCFAVRIVTVSPVMAFVLFTALKLLRPEIFGGWLQYICAVLFISVFPVAAYPLQPLIPGYRGRGREGQRNLAIVMSVMGYLLSILAGVVFSATTQLWILYLTYFFSGALILLFNKVIKLRASGHACGVAGPVAAMLYFLGARYWPTVLVLALVFWASLQMKRHKLSELVAGSIIPVVAMAMAMVCTGTFLPFIQSAFTA